MTNIEIAQKVFDAGFTITSTVHLASLEFDRQKWEIVDMIDSMSDEDCIRIFGEQMVNATTNEVPEYLHHLVHFKNKGGFILNIERMIFKDFKFGEDGEWESASGSPYFSVAHVYGDTYDEAILNAVEWADADWDRQIKEAKEKQ